MFLTVKMSSSTSYSTSHQLDGECRNDDSENGVGLESLYECREKAPSKYDNKAVRGSSDAIYLVRDGELHWIPDEATFISLHLKFDEVLSISDEDIGKFIIGTRLPGDIND